jgi:beta-lactam-binding protein with PASTA domain
VLIPDRQRADLEPPLAVPDVYGMTAPQAMESLAAAGLLPTMRPFCGEPDGQVLEVYTLARTLYGGIKTPIVTADGVSLRAGRLEPGDEVVVLVGAGVDCWNK